mmetsp:Transcript_20458/g.37312  ORF Transcript_20458/g.37312 Transcript_20458/m.37312 type:complete len:214 (+) Transcript_20458:2519-3160(+)
MVKFIWQGDLRLSCQKCLHFSHDATKARHQIDQCHEVFSNDAMLVHRQAQTNGVVRRKGAICQVQVTQLVPPIDLPLEVLVGALLEQLLDIRVSQMELSCHEWTHGRRILLRFVVHCCWACLQSQHITVIRGQQSCGSHQKCARSFNLFGAEGVTPPPLASTEVLTNASFRLQLLKLLRGEVVGLCPLICRNRLGGSATHLAYGRHFQNFNNG